MSNIQKIGRRSAASFVAGRKYAEKYSACADKSSSYAEKNSAQEKDVFDKYLDNEKSKRERLKKRNVLRSAPSQHPDFQKYRNKDSDKWSTMDWLGFFLNYYRQIYRHESSLFIATSQKKALECIKNARTYFVSNDEFKKYIIWGLIYLHPACRNSKWLKKEFKFKHLFLNFKRSGVEFLLTEFRKKDLLYLDTEIGQLLYELSVYVKEEKTLQDRETNLKHIDEIGFEKEMLNVDYVIYR